MVHLEKLYFTLAGISVVVFAITLSAFYPFWKFDFNNAKWDYFWFAFTVTDYYVLSSCLTIIMFKSEKLCDAMAWTLGMWVIGSPAACAWIVFRLNNRSLHLCDKDPDPEHKKKREVEEEARNDPYY